MDWDETEDKLLRSVALQNARAILLARENAEKERKQAEETTHETAERLQLALAAGHLGDWRWDASTNLVDLSQQAAEILGVTTQQPVSRDQIRERLHSDDRERAWLAVETALAAHSDYEIEYRVTKPNDERWVLDKGRGLYDKRGRVLGMIGVVQDITERKRSDEVRYRLAALVESSDDAIISMTLETVITTWNLGAERMFGYTAAEVIGKSVSLLIPANREDEEPAILEKLSKGERVEHYETVRRRKDGTLLNVSLTVSPIHDRDGTIIGVSKISRDITERKRSEEKLRQAQRQLRDHAKNLEQQVSERTASLRETIGELEAFSYSISHDMRAPLRAMQSFGLILAEECSSQLSPAGKEYIRRITTSAERLDRLIQDVLTYSRVARTELKLAPVDVEKLLRDILESYPMFQPPTVQVRLEGAFPHVLGAEALLTQSISNLLSNSVKFVAPGVVPEVLVRAEKVGADRVRLLFTDNGLGIEKEAQANIFGMFQRLSNHYEGTGIGLAIVKKAVERMGGSTGVESSPGRGSTFWLELKRAKDPDHDHDHEPTAALR